MDLDQAPSGGTLEGIKMMMEAVKEVKRVLRENPDWSFRYCIQNVARRYQVDYGALMSAVGTSTRGKIRKRIERKLKQPEGIPWWQNY